MSLMIGGFLLEDRRLDVCEGLEEDKWVECRVLCSLQHVIRDCQIIADTLHTAQPTIEYLQHIVVFKIII
jgi:hypothetical protein